MSDEHDSTVRGAFERLRNDAHGVDAMAALRNTRNENRPNGIGPALAGAAAAAILLIAGFVFFGNREGGEVFAGDPTTTTNGDTGDAPFDPAGTSWILASGTTSNGPIPIVAGWPITLEFRDDIVTGTSACNGYGANYTFEESAITIAQPDHDDAGCDGNVMASEIAFIAALPVVDTIGMNARSFADNFRTPHTDKLRVTERFRLIEGGEKLEIHVTAADPDTFVQPWQGIRRYNLMTGDREEVPEGRVAMAEVICQEGNFVAIDYDSPIADTLDF